MLLEQKKFTKHFSTPIMHFHFPEHEPLNQELLKEGAKMRKESEGITKSNRGGWHSAGNLYKNTAPSIKILRALSEECVNACMKKVGAKADLTKLDMELYAWMNVNPVMGFNAPHTHPGAHWSGVYYISQPEIEEGNSGMIEFLNPRTDLPNWRILDIPAFGSKTKFRPKPGEMILFPSYLMHWVYPNETDQERVTVAFNATFKKKKKSKEKA